MATVTDGASKPQTVSLSDVERKFAIDVSRGTGVDPRVIMAQEQAEGAYAKGGTGGLNFLNLRTGTVSSLGDTYQGQSAGGFAQFSSLAAAEKATIDEYRSGAIAPYLKGIAPGSGQSVTPRGQISELAASPWDGGHYSGLLGDYTTLFGSQSLDQPPLVYNNQTGGFVSGNTNNVSAVGIFSPEGVAAVGALVTGGALAGLTGPEFAGAGAGVGAGEAATGGGAAGGGAGAAISKLLGSAAGKTGTGVGLTYLAAKYGDHWLQRGAEMAGGGVLIMLGIIMLGSAASKSGPAAQTRGAVETAAAPLRRRRRSTARRPTSAPRTRSSESVERQRQTDELRSLRLEEARRRQAAGTNAKLDQYREQKARAQVRTARARARKAEGRRPRSPEKIPF